MPGFSTPVWGPPLWRILHTLSFGVRPPDVVGIPVDDTMISTAIAREDATAVAMWVESLGYCMPCSYCRESFLGFFSEMEVNYGSLGKVVWNGHFPRWMYTLHELVNDKLDFQFFQQEVRGRRFDFECIERRYTITPISFCEKDVWDVLSLFALNIQIQLDEAGVSDELDNIPPELHQRMISFMRFAEQLPRWLSVVGVDLRYGAGFDVRYPFNWVCRERRLDIGQQKAHYLVAQAGVCVDGSCI